MSNRPDNKSRGFPFGPVFIGLLVVYFGPFLAVLADEWVLKSNWFEEHAPSWWVYAFTTAYTPLIKIFELLL